MLILGGIETGLIFGLKEAKKNDVRWPVILMAVLSACLLAAGVLRHYWDIYVHRTVRGISFFFVGIDAAGDLFSIISVCKFTSHFYLRQKCGHICGRYMLTMDDAVFGSKVDVLGVVIYGTELGLWTGIFICGGVFNLLPWVRARSKREEGREEEPEPVALDRMPSSTSVFRTASGQVVERRAWLTS
jgi:hypothetical protein